MSASRGWACRWHDPCTGSKHLGRLGAWPSLTLGFFLPKTLPNSRYIFISLIGSNRLLIEINRENISKTLKQALPLTYVLKINLVEQPEKRVNCSFRQKSMRSLQRATHPRCPASESTGNVCAWLGTVDAAALAWL